MSFATDLPKLIRDYNEAQTLLNNWRSGDKTTPEQCQALDVYLTSLKNDIHGELRDLEGLS